MTKTLKEMISPSALFSFYPLLGKFLRIFGVKPLSFQHFLINWNNTYVLKNNIRKGEVKNVMILLPHCIQNSACVYRVTWDKLENCRSCGACPVSDFKNLNKPGVYSVIVTGGTAAREIIKERRPDLIIAVACENDMLSGLRDVKKIPVLGFLNERPKGPCRDTLVNIAEIRTYLDLILS
jgi:uncharacterized protein